MSKRKILNIEYFMAIEFRRQSTFHALDGVAAHFWLLYRRLEREFPGIVTKIIQTFIEIPFFTLRSFSHGSLYVIAFSSALDVMEKYENYKIREVLC